MKMNNKLLITSGLHEFMMFLRQQKIKHEPIQKVKDKNNNTFHLCTIMKDEDLTTIALAMNENYKLPEKGMAYYKP